MSKREQGVVWQGYWRYLRRRGRAHCCRYGAQGRRLNHPEKAAGGRDACEGQMLCVASATDSAPVVEATRVGAT
jgi:hypothetical protein